MKTTDFVDCFCGPDRSALEVVRECQISSMGDLFCQMRDDVRDGHITEQDGSDAKVDYEDACHLFTNRLLEDIQYRMNENS